jgi:hypothetical protein
MRESFCGAEERRHEAVRRPRNDVAGDELAHLLGRVGSGLDGRTHAAHVTLHDRRHVGVADAHPLENLHVGRLGHRVGGLDEAHESLGLQKSDRRVHG